MTAEIPPRIVAEITFIGRSSGMVKALEGFRKAHHSVPDAANAATNAFLGKISSAELSSQAEQLFQRVREQLGYKRKELMLSLGSGSAVLTARQFIVEIMYALEDAHPERYTVTMILRGLKSAELLRTDAFNDVFRSRFSEISFRLARGAKVEDIIDAIEALDSNKGISVHFPSDCRECVIRVDGVDAHVRCTADSLEVVFPRAASPAELVDGFMAVRGAFQVSPQLSGLIA